MPKVYEVEVQHPLAAACVKALAEGMYFEYENQTTAPAALRILFTHTAQVVLTEGKYHPIKRMFGRFVIQCLSCRVLPAALLSGPQATRSS